MNRTTALLGVLLVAALCLPTAAAADPIVEAKIFLIGGEGIPAIGHPCDKPGAPETYCMVHGLYKTSAEFADAILDGNYTTLGEVYRAVLEYREDMEGCIEHPTDPAYCDHNLLH